MKWLLVFHLIVLLVSYGCLEFKPDQVEGFVPGTYIRFLEQEFGTEYDTLIITLQKGSAGEYRILRKWKHEKAVPEYSRTIHYGAYDGTHRLLRENETGDIYFFDQRQKILFNGPFKYQKL